MKAELDDLRFAVDQQGYKSRATSPHVVAVGGHRPGGFHMLDYELVLEPVVDSRECVSQQLQYFAGFLVCFLFFHYCLEIVIHTVGEIDRERHIDAECVPIYLCLC